MFDSQQPNGLKITLSEKVNRSVLKYLIDNFDELKYRPEVDATATLTLLKKYMKDLKRDGRLEVSYYQCKHNTGRYFANVAHIKKKQASMQGMPREFRHTLGRDFYYDIDMKNAHPSLLIQYCQKNDINCEGLADYVENRETIIADISEKSGLSREEIKRAFLSVVNGGGGSVKNTELTTHPKFVAVKNEIAGIHALIANKQENHNFHLICKRKKEFNVLGSTVNMLLCLLENNCLIALCEYLQTVAVKVGVLVFDGCQVEKTSDLSEDRLKSILCDASKYIENATGYKIELMIKPMDQGFEIPKLSNVGGLGFQIAADDKMAATMFINQHADRIVKCGNRIFVRTDDYLWTEDEKEVNDVMIRLCMDCNIMKCDDKDNLKPYSTNLPGAKKVVETARTRLQNNQDFVDKILWPSTIGKLCYRNGVYNFETKKFTPWENCSDVYSTTRIDRDLQVDTSGNVIKPSDADLQLLHDEILEPIFGEDSIEIALKFTARAIAGKYEDKQWGLSIGERNCGKGVYVNLNENTWGGGYVHTVSGDSFLMNKHTDNNDTSKLKWMKPCEFRRLTFTQEMKFDVSNTNIKLDGSMIKKKESGGDVQCMRVLFGNEQNIRLQSRLWMIMNDMPPVSPTDTLQTMVLFKHPHKFVDQKTVEEMNLPTFRLASENIKSDLLRRPNIIRAFEWMVFEAYSSNKVVLSGKVAEDVTEFKEDAGDELSLIRSRFEFTRNMSDSVSSSVVDEEITSLKLNMSANRIKTVMEILGAKYNKNAVRKANGKGYDRGYKGVKLIRKCAFEDDDDVDY